MSEIMLINLLKGGFFMPVYEYECESCGKIVEQMQKISDPNPERCECGGKLHKLISNSSFHLKGTGWYVTDYKGNGSKTQHKKTTDKSSSAEPSAATPSSTPTPSLSNSCNSCSCHA
ncbi:MAG: FmdB family zinc ribbon protein [Dissulfurimicrobium sp.]|uniref:FmdB family zinc ribbon protein n=1 Tax=Dissulfurimicrobium sp. TaxID=2022436 RepID=UPI00404B91D7